MDQDDMKRAAAYAALDLVERGAVVGVGTGSTAAFFIESLAGAGVAGAVASSEDSERRLRAAGVSVMTLDDVGGRLGLYVDGADQVDPLLRLVKGAGGAMVREKVLATAADRFACIVDASKLVPMLGGPIPLEVLPMARAAVRSTLEALGGRVQERQAYVTDNGDAVFDVSGLDVTDPEALEIALETLPGVVGCGIFARRRADVTFVGDPDGLRIVERGREA